MTETGEEGTTISGNSTVRLEPKWLRTLLFSHENQTPVPDCVGAQDPYVMISGGGGAVGGVRAVRAVDPVGCSPLGYSWPQ